MAEWFVEQKSIPAIGYNSGHSSVYKAKCIRNTRKQT